MWRTSRVIDTDTGNPRKYVHEKTTVSRRRLLRLPSTILNVSFVACCRRARGATWRDSLRGMQTSSEHITETSWSRSRSYAGEKQMLPPECPTLSSPPVIRSPFTCPGNTRWANPSYSLSLGRASHPPRSSMPGDSTPFIAFAHARGIMRLWGVVQ